MIDRIKTIVEESDLFTEVKLGYENKYITFQNKKGTLRFVAGDVPEGNPDDMQVCRCIKVSKFAYGKWGKYEKDKLPKMTKEERNVINLIEFELYIKNN